MKRAYLRFIVAFLSFFFVGSVMANPLWVSVDPSETEGLIDISLANSGTEPVSVLLWDTPFEQTLSSNVFLIEKAVKDFPFMEVAKYSGRSVKRSAPSAEHYRIIQPGKMIRKSVKLNDYYDIKRFGEHRVQFAGNIHYKVVGGIEGRAKSTPDSIATLNHAKLLSGSVDVSLVPSLRPRLRPPTYDSCSVQEIGDIVEAANIAETLVDTALSDLASLLPSERASSPRYIEWFGTVTDNRYNRVVSNLSAIDQALESETLQFNCGCTDAGVFAYVYPAFPYSITLCPSFRNASPNGQDSRAGTIIHELSHFNVVAATDDHAYSHVGVRALAISSPDTAITNADSYEYFAENAPIVPIRQSGIVEPPIAYPSLPLETQIQGDVEEGRNVTFQVTNANRIELISNSGDADLSVYRDNQLSDQICLSANSAVSPDVCDLVVNGTIYVQVLGFTDATFTLTAEGESQIANDDSIQLTLGTPVTGSVAANNRDIYQVTDADLIELESLSGDADLYVFSSLDLTSGSLVCASNNLPLMSTMDSCNIPSNQSTYYVSVVGYSGADYSLEARSTVSTNVVRLIAGQEVSGNVAAGSFAYYVVSGVESVVLTSTTGDADLLVTSDPNFQENDTSCTSLEYSSDSLTDTCSVPNGDDHYVLVRGDTDATYTIIGNATGSSLPADDDPGNTLVSTPSRRSGATGVLGLCFLFMFVGFRVINNE